MEDSKKWWASKTIWGAIITVAAVICGLFGIELSADEQAALADSAVAVASGIAALVGAGVTVYGRIKADKPIK